MLKISSPNYILIIFDSSQTARLRREILSSRHFNVRPQFYSLEHVILCSVNLTFERRRLQLPTAASGIFSRNS